MANIPCDLTRGRGLTCKDAIGGLKFVYFIDYDSFDGRVVAEGGDVTFVTGSRTIDNIEPKDDGGVPVDPKPNAYRYELHLGNDLTQNINSSPENGTTFFEQILNLTLKKLTADDNEEIRNLVVGHPHVIVEDNMGNLMLVGRINGADVTGGTAVTGNDFGDLNGYTLAFTAREIELANFFAPAYKVEDDFVVVTDSTVSP